MDNQRYTPSQFSFKSNGKTENQKLFFKKLNRAIKIIEQKQIEINQFDSIVIN